MGRGFSVSLDGERSLALAQEQADRAMALAPEAPLVFLLRAVIAFMHARYDEAIELCGKAVERAPSDSRGRGYLGMLHNYRGSSEQADTCLAEVARSSPHMDSWMVYYSALAKFWVGDLKTALALAERYVVMEPIEPYGQLYLAVIQEALGNSEHAAATIERLGKTCPAFGIDNILRSERYRDRARLDRVANVLSMYEATRLS